ncbi:MAG TPA: GYD domain-containing protein [Methylocella sp.]|nr:GYD domain-containing protein [Methylocella sp.]
MPKYLFQAAYTAEGIKGLEKDKASGRKAALSRAIEGLGGKLECFYLSFGDHDWVLIADLPDNASAAAFSFAVSGSGLLRAATTPLVTAEETDTAIQKKAHFQAPGQFTAG